MTDQRGIVRGTPSSYTGPLPDIGAYEAQFVSVQANQTTTYGTSLPTTLPYVITNGPANSQSLLSGAVAIVTPEINAGVYVGDIGVGTLSISGTTYLLDYMTSTLTINPALLTITAANDSKTYDGTAYTGGNGVTYSGFVYNDNPSSLIGTLDYLGTAQGAIDAGLYTIVPDGLSSTNYTIIPVDGTLSIIPRVAIPPLGPFPQFSSGIVEYDQEPMRPLLFDEIEDDRRKIPLFPGNGKAYYTYRGNWKSGLPIILEMSSANVK